MVWQQYVLIAEAIFSSVVGAYIAGVGQRLTPGIAQRTFWFIWDASCAAAVLAIWFTYSQGVMATIAAGILITAYAWAASRQIVHKDRMTDKLRGDEGWTTLQHRVGITVILAITFGQISLIASLV